MRILFDARPGEACLTGIGRYARTLADVLAAGVPGHQTWTLGRDVELASTTLLGEELELPSLLEREELDAFHSPLWRLPAVLPCHAIVTVHDAIPAVRPELTDASFTRLFVGAIAAARRASAVVCPSAHAKAEVTRALGLEEEKVHVVRECPARVFRRLEGPAIQCALDGLELDRAFVLVVGSLEKRKNPTVVLDALKRLDSAAPLAVFAGPDAGVDLLREADQRSVRGLVRKLGPVDDDTLVALLNEAVALVFPSLHEGFGLPIVEAFACGTPVVASSATAIPEVAGDAALFFDPESPDALTAQLERVLGSPALRVELRARGLDRVRAFSEDEVRTDLARLYTSLEGRAA